MNTITEFLVKQQEKMVAFTLTNSSLIRPSYFFSYWYFLLQYTVSINRRATLTDVDVLFLENKLDRII